MNLDPQKSAYIVIPVHNRKEITLKCLQHLKQCGDLQQYQTIVIDDGSTDGTAEAIDRLYPEVTILTGDGNLWWTGAIALGMKYAIKQQEEYIIWLNDDCLPAQGTLDTLLEFLQTHPNSIAGAACYLGDTNTLVENGCVGRTRLSASPNTVVSVETLAGYCTAFPVSVCAAIGLPNAKCFPHYKGDVMYILKAVRSGFKPHIVGNAKVFIQDIEQPTHNFTQYLEQRFKGHTPIKSVFFAKKSRYYLPTELFYYIKKYNFIKGVPVFILKFIGWLLQYIKFELTVVLRLN